MIRLIPREEKFFEMFSAMAQNVHEASKLLRSMMENPNEIHDLAESIKALEHKGDRMIHDLMTKLNKTFVVPIDREDLVHVRQLAPNPAEKLLDGDGFELTLVEIDDIDLAL